MGFENRIVIQKLLFETPGIGGAIIAKMMGMVLHDIEHDIAFLRKNNIIRREGVKCHARWYAVDGTVVLRQTRGPKQFSSGMNYGGRLCEYHQTNERGKGVCARCQALPDASVRKRDAALKRMFPGVFAN